MTTAEQLFFKEGLKQFCQQHIEQRIAAAKESIKNAQEAANSEEKSSAGDKYETGRAMGHLQKDMHARQLAAYMKELADLKAVNTNVICSYAAAGAFIITDQSSFFIAAGLGKQVIDGQQILFLSPQAPLTGILQNKNIGDAFVFNKASVTIMNLF
ncbi:MAG: hypothetical protein ABIQ88_06845 [Chitinophagaceae bacterium]